MIREAVITAVRSAGFPEGLLRLEYGSGRDELQDNALLLPPRKGCDWIVSLHGFAGHANQIFVRNDIRRAWLPAYLETGMGIFSPNLRGDEWMSPAAEEDLCDLLAYLSGKYGRGKYYFSSGSMGAYSSLMFACRHPEWVAGLDLHGTVCDMAAYYDFCKGGTTPLHQAIAYSLELAYGGTPEERPETYRRQSPIYYTEALRGKPFMLIQGSHDEMMPVGQSRRLAAAMGDEAAFSYIELPGGGHNAPLGVERNLIPGFMDPLEWMAHDGL